MRWFGLSRNNYEKNNAFNAMLKIMRTTKLDDFIGIISAEWFGPGLNFILLDSSGGFGFLILEQHKSIK